MSDTPLTPETVVAANVRRLRKALDLTQEELSERVAKAGHNISVMSMWTIENDRRRIRVDDLVALAEALETTPQQLLSGEAEPAVVERLYEVKLEGGFTERATADRTEQDGTGWLNFYLRGERVLYAPVSRILGVRVHGESQ